MQGFKQLNLPTLMYQHLNLPPTIKFAKQYAYYGDNIWKNFLMKVAFSDFSEKHFESCIKAIEYFCTNDFMKHYIKKRLLILPQYKEFNKNNHGTHSHGTLFEAHIAYLMIRNKKLCNIFMKWILQDALDSFVDPKIEKNSAFRNLRKKLKNYNANS